MILELLGVISVLFPDGAMLVSTAGKRSEASIGIGVFVSLC